MTYTVILVFVYGMFYTISMGRVGGLPGRCDVCVSPEEDLSNGTSYVASQLRL